MEVYYNFSVLDFLYTMINALRVSTLKEKPQKPVSESQSPVTFDTALNLSGLSFSDFSKQTNPENVPPVVYIQ